MATRRVCAQPGCPTLVDQGAYRGLCPTHRKERDAARGSRTDRGYGADHQRARRAWQRRIDAGEPVRCWRCGALVAGTDWHLDHTSERDGYRGPACTSCNLHLAGRARHGLVD